MGVGFSTRVAFHNVDTPIPTEETWVGEGIVVDSRPLEATVKVERGTAFDNRPEFELPAWAFVTEYAFGALGVSVHLGSFNNVAIRKASQAALMEKGVPVHLDVQQDQADINI